MKTFFKILAGLIVISIIAVAGFLYTFNANSYKEEISNLAEAMTGRPVIINGDISILLYPLIEIKVEELIVENPPGFSKTVFAAIDKFDVKIEIWPMLQKRLDIQSLVMSGAAIDFEKNASEVRGWPVRT
jgi:AsmA protein